MKDPDGSKNFLKLIRENKLVQSLRGEYDRRWPGPWKAVQSLHEQIAWECPRIEREDTQHHGIQHLPKIPLRPRTVSLQ